MHISRVDHNFGSQANALAIAHTELAATSSPQTLTRLTSTLPCLKSSFKSSAPPSRGAIASSTFEILCICCKLLTTVLQDHEHTPADYLKGTSRRIICVHGPNLDYAAMATTGLSILALGQMDAKERDDRIAIVARFRYEGSFNSSHDTYSCV